MVVAVEKFVGVQIGAHTSGLRSIQQPGEFGWWIWRTMWGFHRVRSPGPSDHRGARYSIAYFAQANSEVTIAGPHGKYPPISAKD